MWGVPEPFLKQGVAEGFVPEPMWSMDRPTFQVQAHLRRTAQGVEMANLEEHVTTIMQGVDSPSTKDDLTA